MTLFIFALHHHRIIIQKLWLLFIIGNTLWRQSFTTSLYNVDDNEQQIFKMSQSSLEELDWIKIKNLSIVEFTFSMHCIRYCCNCCAFHPNLIIIGMLALKSSRFLVIRLKSFWPQNSLSLRIISPKSQLKKPKLRYAIFIINGFICAIKFEHI